MNKKTILVAGMLGLLSFAGMFALGLLTKKFPENIPNEPNQPLLAQAEIQNEQLPQEIDTAPVVEKTSVTISMSEQQLRNLIHDLRNKMQDYEGRLQALNLREQRLQIAQDVLRQDIEKLNNLQIELASITANIKSQQEKLLQSKLEIDQIERTNLVSLASSYDKMDATSASKILANMCLEVSSDTGQNKPAYSSGSSFDDAVKILYYMTERTKAKLLAELANSEPQLASMLSRRLKQITEVN